ncbi:MAG TPA: hypothetical protein DD490_24330 [Acidobacteria bacterium]|nr:hypothetical protein [Acidobacteriota bacterium]
MSSYRRLSVSAAVLSTLFFASVASQAQPWVGTSGSAVVDESAVGIYEASIGQLTYLTGSTSSSTISAYFNLTDTSATGNPSWNTLEVAYYDNSPNTLVRAQIFRVVPGATSTVATCTSTDSSLATRRLCTFTAGAVNFNAGDAYIVAITISRSSSADPTPRFYFVRVF